MKIPFRSGNGRIEVPIQDVQYEWERFIPAKIRARYEDSEPADGGSEITAVYYALPDLNGNPVKVDISSLLSLDNEETLEAIDEYEINERIQQKADAKYHEMKEGIL